MPKRSTYPKVCPKCKALKPKEAYKLRIDKTRKSGQKHCAFCIPCQYEYDKRYTPEEKAMHRLWSRRSRLKATFGLTEDQYIEKMYSQRLRCGICRNIAELFLDHCHITGTVREFLCRKCNTVLGMAKDNVAILREAIRYLRKYGG